MKDLTITSVIKVYEYDELNDTDRALLDERHRGQPSAATHLTRTFR